LRKFSVGLALGGGGARGAAHIGVLQVLDRAGISIDKIAGTSAGSVIGAMYAATKNPEWIEKRFREFLESSVFEQLGTKTLRSDRDPDSVFGQLAKFIQDQFVIVMAMNRISVVKRERLEAVIKFLLPVNTFEELQIPMDVFVTDIQTGQSVCHSRGDLIEAIVQSSSVPGYVPPTMKNGQVFMDGGISTPIPVMKLKQETDFVIAVDISRGQPSPMKKINMLEIMTRSERITSFHLTNYLVKQADFVIRPDVLGLHWSQFDAFDTLLNNGIKAAEERVPDLAHELRRRKSWFYRLKQWLGIRE